MPMLRIRHKGTEASFDLFNMISGYCTSGTLASCKGQEWACVYTADDERIATYRANTGSGLQKVFTIRDLGNRLLTRDEQRHDFVYGHFVEDYVWRGDRLLGARQYGSATMRHFGLDHLGTIRLTTDGSGNVSGNDTYRPFGVEATTSVDDEPMRFTGHERDLQTTSSNPEDDVDYMHVRFYGPGMGRFRSADRAPGSSSVPVGWNRNSYSLGNPLKYLDPTGDISIVFDFTSSPVALGRTQDEIMSGVADAYRTAGVLEVNVFRSTDPNAPAANDCGCPDAVAVIGFPSSLEGGGFGGWDAGDPAGEVNVSRAFWAGGDREGRLNFLINVATHESAHGLGVFPEYSMDGANGPSGDSCYVMEQVYGTPAWAREIGKQRLQFHREETGTLRERLNRKIVLLAPSGGSL